MTAAKIRAFVLLGPFLAIIAGLLLAGTILRWGLVAAYLTKQALWPTRTTPASAA